MKTIASNGLALIVLLIIASCTSKNNVQNEISTTGYVHFNSTIDSFLQSFIQNVEHKNSYFEMYIDKRDDDETIISLRASMNYPENINDDKELLNNYVMYKNPSLYTIVEGSLFFIYVGLEDLVDIQCYDDKLALSKDSTHLYEYQWVIRKNGEKYEKYENILINPFERQELKVIEYVE